ncbi:MAG TPA: hypothetical protein PKC30_15325 [Saprospiraceae bacterium]|nr:hypothetical protein [Saprospiraceae bacterium]
MSFQNIFSVGFALISILWHTHLYTQVPIIHATSEIVDIRDGDVWYKGKWILSPKTNPDIYKTRVKDYGQKITFYTDSDSISFQVENNQTYDFIILLNERDTCRTQINTIPDFKFSSE